MKLFKIGCVVTGLIFGVFHGNAEEATNRLSLDASTLTPTLRQTGMPDLGEGRLEKILRRYYKDTLGDNESWSEISSLKISGTLEMEAGEFALTAIQKKPNLAKITLRRNNRDLVLAFDGTHAWQSAPGLEADAVLMEEEEARQFKHSVQFGNYLLYPYAEGKEMAYIDTVPVDGTICHQIRVTLDSGFQMDYFIDIRSYVEVRVDSKDLISGSISRLVYSDYIREEGIPIATKVESYKDGEWISTLTLNRANVNSGVIPWMFSMPGSVTK